MQTVKSKILSTMIGAAVALGAAAAEARTSGSTAARDQAIDTAEYLVATLVDIQDVASHLADRAARRGNAHDAHALDNVADSAATLEQKVVNQILYPLYDGATFAYVK